MVRIPVENRQQNAVYARNTQYPVFLENLSLKKKEHQMQV